MQGGCRRDVAITYEGLTQRTYYLYKRAYKDRSLVGLEKRSCRPHNMRKPTWLESKTYELVVAVRKAHPTEGKEIIHATLLMQGKMPFSVATVGNMRGREEKSQRCGKRLEEGEIRGADFSKKGMCKGGALGGSVGLGAWFKLII